jgi:hypothetical protein
MRKLILPAVLIVLLAAAVLAWVSIRTVHEASLFFEEMQRLSPDTLTNNDAKRLADRFHSYMLPQQQECTDAECEYGFRFDNSVLAALKLAPYLRLNGGIKLENGKLALLGAVFHQYPEPQFDVSVLEFRSAPELPSFNARLVERNDAPNFITVKMTGAAQPNEKRPSPSIRIAWLGCEDADHLSKSYLNCFKLPFGSEETNRRVMLYNSAGPVPYGGAFPRCGTYGE